MKFLNFVSLLAFVVSSESKFSCYYDFQGNAKCRLLSFMDTLKSEMAVLQEDDSSSIDSFTLKLKEYFS